jgi:hypothetical protein
MIASVESRPSAWDGSASGIGIVNSETYETMCAWRVMYPHPMWAVMCEEVLATVLVITSGTTHFGLLPAGSKAF